MNKLKETWIDLNEGTKTIVKTSVVVITIIATLVVGMKLGSVGMVDEDVYNKVVEQYSELKDNSKNTPEKNVGEEIDNNKDVEIKNEEKPDVVEDNSIKIGKEDKNPRVLPENLQMEKYLDEPDSIGTIYGHVTVTNNSEYTISYIEFKFKYTNKEGQQDVVYYSSYDSILPGEKSLDMESFGSEDMEVISVEYRILDTETLLECNVEYDNKTGIIQWSPWHEMY